jgi:hypothetical protein
MAAVDSDGGRWVMAAGGDGGDSGRRQRAGTMAAVDGGDGRQRRPQQFSNKIPDSYVCDSKIWIQIFDRRKKNVTHTAILNNHKNRVPNNLTTNPNAAASTRRMDDARTRNAIATYRPIQRFP